MNKHTAHSCCRLLLALLLALPIHTAIAQQPAAPVSQAVEDFLRIQTQGLPGQVDFEITPLDPRNNLVACTNLEVSLAGGARLWGRSSVMVRCLDAGGWRIHVPVTIRVISDYLLTARALTRGQLITAADLARSNGDLTSLPNGILTDEAQAIGRTLTLSMPAGRPLRGDMLRDPMAVQQNQSVKVISRGPGFQVAGNDGRALNAGADGEVVQVRMANGRIVSGIARPGGVVEISY
ncbi:MAG: flagellar basal body P-ring formation protein FlgA [Sterolibacterium sp.]|nr:flagellar basal body P-ring formation protein FlgA [Sterolibacterium sp.]